jgi:hypothetical protein
MVNMIIDYKQHVPCPICGGRYTQLHFRSGSRNCAYCNKTGKMTREQAAEFAKTLVKIKATVLGRFPNG